MLSWLGSPRWPQPVPDIPWDISPFAGEPRLGFDEIDALSRQHFLLPLARRMLATDFLLTFS